MSDIEFGKCYGCNGRCCNNLSLHTNLADINMFGQVGNKIEWVNQLSDIPSNGEGVLFVNRTPESDSEYPSLRIYQAKLPGSCNALLNGLCTKHDIRPDVCRYYKAGVNCNGPC